MNLPQTIFADDMPEFMWNLAAALIEGPYDPALELCKPVVYQAVRDNFTSSATPDNQDWPPRKVIGDGHPLLIDTGSMLQAATGGAGAESDISRDGMGEHTLAVGINSDVIPYAATHQYGSTKKRNIPQREFFGMHEVAIDEAEQIIANFVAETISGGMLARV